MSEKIHTLETELIEQVLKDQPDFVAVLDDLAGRYGLPARHVLLISNYLQKDLPPGVPAGTDKLLALCQQVRQGYYRIDTANGDLVLLRERDDIPEMTEPEPQWPSDRQAEPALISTGQPAPEPQASPAPQQSQEERPRSKGPSLAFAFIALAALAAAGYFLYRYMGQ